MDHFVFASVKDPNISIVLLLHQWMNFLCKVMMNMQDMENKHYYIINIKRPTIRLIFGRQNRGTILFHTLVYYQPYHVIILLYFESSPHISHSKLTLLFIYVFDSIY